jgi:hypothetical protein
MPAARPATTILTHTPFAAQFWIPDAVVDAIETEKSAYNLLIGPIGDICTQPS